MKRRIEHSTKEQIKYWFESNSMLQIATLITVIAIGIKIAPFIIGLINAGRWGIM